jgi:anti-sigma factor RsiW
MPTSADKGRCAWVGERIDAMVAGDLAFPEEAVVARHLMACAACAAELGAAERVEAELRALPVLDAPPELVRRLAAIPGPALRVRRWSTAWPWPVALAAALALLVAAGGWWGREWLRPAAAPRAETASALAPSAAEIQQATPEARQALAVVARLGRKARDEVRDEVLIDRVAVPVLENLGWRGRGAGDATAPRGGEAS